MNKWKPWKPQSLSAYFETTARFAESYADECLGKISRTDTYKKFYDEYIAKFYVFNYLHGKTFLETPELFLAEMKQYVGRAITAPRGVFDKEIFEEYRIGYAQGLINEVLREWPELSQRDESLG